MRLETFLLRAIVVTAFVVAAAGGGAAQQGAVDLVIRDRVGAQPRLAIPNCLALTTDTETVAASETIAEVLGNDIDFEREFRLIPARYVCLGSDWPIAG